MAVLFLIHSIIVYLYKISGNKKRRKMVQIDIITDYIEFENTLKGKKAVICFQ